ncbi:MAG: hypothetical protein R3C58_05655 [Parvularculaceae bacterium]
MVGNRTILIGMIVATAGLVATEYATAHHLIELPGFAPSADEAAPAAVEATAPAESE